MCFLLQPEQPGFEANKNKAQLDEALEVSSRQEKELLPQHASSVVVCWPFCFALLISRPACPKVNTATAKLLAYIISAYRMSDLAQIIFSSSAYIAKQESVAKGLGFKIKSEHSERVYE